MPTVEELYRNYGILADATETAGQVRCGCGLQGLARPRACVAPRRGVPGRGGAGEPAGVPSEGLLGKRTAGEPPGLCSGWVSEPAGGNESAPADLQGALQLPSLLQHPRRVGSSPSNAASRMLTGS